MPEITQQGRLIGIDTPLGADVLLLRSFTGTEGMNRIFHFHLDLLSTNFNLNFDDIMGRNVTVRVRIEDGSERCLNGHIVRFAQLPVEGHLARYEAVMAPWLWFLTRTADCKIFQEKSVPDILSELFDEYGFPDYELQLQGSYEPRTYCVQYRETDANFVMRLMEEEGIFFFFRHEDGRHVMVIGDNPSVHRTLPGQSQLRFEHVVGPGMERDEDVIFDWCYQHEYRTGKYALKDYNFETPSTDLLTQVESTIDQGGNKSYEVYDHPGDYLNRSRGDTLVRTRIEEEETPHEVVNGAGNCRVLAVGYKFDLIEHDRQDQNREYLVTSVTHSAHSGAFIAGTQGEGATYANSFTCIPSRVHYRPLRVTPKPVVEGCQTAVVTGPAGEEIYTDKYGRIKVQFHWDRLGSHNERSSCWMRVAQLWAGKQWGAMYIPRIGHEVVVDFLEGDPDRPLITGSLYHAENMPHYDLPGFQTLAYIKSNSSKGRRGFNEIRFEDKTGSEQVFLHSEKRMDIRAKASCFQTNGGERHILSGAGIFVHGKDANDVHFDADRFEKLDGKLHVSVGGNVVGEYKGDEANIVTGKAEWNAREIRIEALTKISLKVGGNCIMIDPSGITIAGTLVKINSGGFATGVVSPVIEDPYDASGADTGEPGYLSRVGRGGGRGPRNRRRVAAQHYVAPPRPGESAQMQAIRNRLRDSEAGRHALEVYDRYNVQPNFAPGQAAQYAGHDSTPPNTVYLDSNSASPATTFVHEMGHAEAENEHSGADVQNQSRQDYVDTQLREDARCESQAYQAEQELRDQGHTDNHATVTETAYNNAYNASETQARQDHPEWSEEQVREHAHQDAEDAIYQEYQNGNITTGNTHQPYTDYWGNYWDSQHPGAAGGGGTP